MRRHEPTMDPAVAAELEALEAALAGDPAAEPELAALVRDVRGEAPTMAPEVRARLTAAIERASQSEFAAVGRWDLLEIAEPRSPETESLVGLSVEQAAARRGTTPIELLLDVFDYGTPPFRTLNTEFRRRLLEEAATAGTELIFTFVMGMDEQAEAEKAAERAERAARATETESQEPESDSGSDPESESDSGSGDGV